MIRKLLYLLLLPLGLMNVSAQVNIVPNGDFEQYDICPYSIQTRIEDIIGHNWFTPIPNPDYFNACALSNDLSMPQNISGYQSAYSGSGYLGLDVARQIPSIPLFPLPAYYYNAKETSAVKLKYKLSKDSIYTVGFYVSLADSFAFTMKNWGCMFSKDSLYISSWGNVSNVASEATQKFILDTNAIKVDLFPDSALKNTTGWTKVEATFKAKGGENYMYLGCFIQPYDIIWEPSPNIDNIDTTIDGIKAAYYYIDDVYLYGDTNYKAVGIKENIFEQVKVYPNPAADFITINTGDLKNIQVELFDISGRKLLQQNVVNSLQTLDVSGLSNGVYICVVTAGNRVIKREKVIIAK